MGADGRDSRGQQGNGDSAAYPSGLESLYSCLL